jgi:hypothetical protein
MQEQTVTQHLGRGIGRVAHANTFGSIVACKRTLADVNHPRRHAVQLDFRAADISVAPGRLRRGATVKRDRALHIVNEKNVGAAALLQHIVERAARNGRASARRSAA